MIEIFLHVNIVMLHDDITILLVKIFILHVKIFDRKIACTKREEKMDLGKLNIDFKKKLFTYLSQGFSQKYFKFIILQSNEIYTIF